MGGTLCRDQRCHVAAPLQRPRRLCKPGWNLTAGHEGRQRQKDAWVGAAPRSIPRHARPKRWRQSWSSRQRRARRQGDHVPDDTARLQPLRRRARRVRTTPAVMARIKTDAERRDPHHRTA
jgi:hypothetical protein